MGWLKDALRQVDVKSLPAAAKQLAAGPHAVKQPSPEALANNLRHLDNGDARWWSATGKAWIPALADLLKETPEDLEEIIRAQAAGRLTDAAHEHLVTDWFLKPLDLRAEGPFPAIPVELTAQAGKLGARVWWQADTGSGRTLLGRWLCARWGWERREARTWSEALRDLPPRGRVYLELHQPEAQHANGRDAPPDLQICVVAPFFHQMQEQDPPLVRRRLTKRNLLRFPLEDEPPQTPHPLDWQNITTPSLSEWLKPMLAWVEARLKPNTKYDVIEVRECLDELPLEDWIQTPGDLLDLLAVFDEVGVRAVFGEKSARREALIKAALRRAAQRTGGANPTAAPHPIIRYGATLLISLETERLRRGEPPALSYAAWLALMPSQVDTKPDHAAIDALLKQGTPEAAAKARKLLAASPEARLQNLIDARVLVADADTDEALRLRPPWLQRVLTQEAIDTLMDEGPEGVGVLLLFDQSTEAAMERLLEQALRGDLGLLSRCCEGVTEESPDRLVALNGAFRALGMAAALGVELPVPLMQRVWEVQLQHADPRRGARAPRPRLQVREDEPEGLTSPNIVWEIAALGLSLRLVEAGVSLPRGPLNPWKEPGGVNMESYLTRLPPLWDWPHSSWRAEVREASHRLARHLLDCGGEGCLSPADWWRLLGPNLLVRLAQGKSTPPIPSRFSQAPLMLPWGFAALERACAEEGASIDAVLRWCWSRWCDDTESGIPPLLWDDRYTRQEHHQGMARVWQVAPEEGLSDKFLEHITRAPTVWRHLSLKIWGMWLDWWFESQQYALSDGLIQALPIEIVIEAARRLRVRGDARDANSLHVRQWNERPDETLAYIDLGAKTPLDVDERGISQVGWLLIHAPDAHLPALLARAQGWCERPSTAEGLQDYHYSWLHNLFHRRGPHWREAWRLICLFERTLREEQS